MTAIQIPTSQHLKRKQGGFTALELIVVLLVGLGIYAMSSGKLDMLFSGASIADEVSNIHTLLVNTKGLKTQSGYGASGTDLSAQLVATGGVPTNMTVTAGVLYNDWGGAVVPASTGTGFSITDNAIPQGACIKLSTKISKSGAFASIKLNGNAAIVGEVTSSTATTQCSAGAANVIVYTSAS